MGECVRAERRALQEERSALQEERRQYQVMHERHLQERRQKERHLQEQQENLRAEHIACQKLHERRTQEQQKKERHLQEQQEEKEKEFLNKQILWEKKIHDERMELQDERNLLEAMRRTLDEEQQKVNKCKPEREHAARGLKEPDVAKTRCAPTGLSSWLARKCKGVNKAVSK